MKKKRGKRTNFKELLRNNLLNLFLFFAIACAIGAIAADVIVQEGDIDLENLDVTGNIQLIGGGIIKAPQSTDDLNITAGHYLYIGNNPTDRVIIGRSGSFETNVISNTLNAKGGINVGTATGAGAGDIKLSDDLIASDDATIQGGLNLGTRTGAPTGYIYLDANKYIEFKGDDASNVGIIEWEDSGTNHRWLQIIRSSDFTTPNIIEFMSHDGNWHTHLIIYPYGSGGYVKIPYYLEVTDYITAEGGIHVGGTSDPGTDNLIVDGDITAEKLFKGGNNERSDTGFAKWCDGTDGDTDTGDECCAIYGDSCLSTCQTGVGFSCATACDTDAAGSAFIALCY